jgi:AcrR family transcriptional regulator
MTSATTSVPVLGRRERRRAETVAEIRATARRLLVEQGQHEALSLRAIAREMGMTAPAIYRYFDSLDALVQELVEDLYDELRQEVEAAGDAGAGPGQLDRILDMARGFRRWSVAHPAEFALMFGSPIPGVEQFDESCLSPEHAGARMGAPFLAALHELWRESAIRTLPPDVIDIRLGPYLGPYRITFGDEVPIEVIATYLSGWTRLYGLVAMEVFGHLRWAVTEVEPLFEIELATFVAELNPPRGA